MLQIILGNVFWNVLLKAMPFPLFMKHTALSNYKASSHLPLAHTIPKHHHQHGHKEHIQIPKVLERWASDNISLLERSFWSFHRGGPQLMLKTRRAVKH
jgi:hypothetical protein